jgi:hypothetical protein
VDILKQAGTSRHIRAGRSWRAHSPAAAAQVKHPYIVQCYDVHETPTKLFLFMELCAAPPGRMECPARNGRERDRAPCTPRRRCRRLPA